MAVKLIVDSSSDIIRSDAERLGILHLPMKITFGTEEFKDTVNLSHREFYEKLIESDELPKTSQITPSEFAEEFKSVTENGDSAVVITLSSRLSGTYQSALIAAEDFGRSCGRIFQQKQ